LQQSGIENLGVAVRSSATAEDLPTASFAGRMESYLNISGENSWKRLFIVVMLLYLDRAIKYRHDMGFAKMDIAISVGVQQMVRSDKAAAGVSLPSIQILDFKIQSSSTAVGVCENIVKEP
jgi:pyruvate,water dikinase